MKRWMGCVVGLVAALSGCAETVPVAQHAQREHRHVSPSPVPAPVFPPEEFDQAKAQAALTAAKSARESGDAAAARIAANTAIAHWPANPAAWQELQSDCTVLGDQPCLAYTGFFLAKLDFTKGISAHAAALGYETLAEAPLGSKAGDLLVDQATLDMAKRLWAFTDGQDRIVVKRDPAEEKSWYQSYPYLGMLAVVGTGAAVITGIKSAANK